MVISGGGGGGTGSGDAAKGGGGGGVAGGQNGGGGPNPPTGGVNGVGGSTVGKLFGHSRYALGGRSGGQDFGSGGAGGFFNHHGGPGITIYTGNGIAFTNSGEVRPDGKPIYDATYNNWGTGEFSGAGGGGGYGGGGGGQASGSYEGPHGGAGGGGYITPNATNVYSETANWNTVPATDELDYSGVYGKGGGAGAHG